MGAAASRLAHRWVHDALRHPSKGQAGSATCAAAGSAACGHEERAPVVKRAGPWRFSDIWQMRHGPPQGERERKRRSERYASEQRWRSRSSAIRMRCGSKDAACAASCRSYVFQRLLSAPGIRRLTWLDLACGRGQILRGLRKNLSDDARAKIDFFAYDSSIPGAGRQPRRFNLLWSPDVGWPRSRSVAHDLRWLQCSHVSSPLSERALLGGCRETPWLVRLQQVSGNAATSQPRWANPSRCGWHLRVTGGPERLGLWLDRST
jgi:hypothetical protein